MQMPYPNLLDIPQQHYQQMVGAGQQQPQKEQGPPSQFEQALQQRFQQTGIPDAMQNARFQLHNAWQNTGIPGQMWGVGQDIQRGLQNAGSLFFGGK
jgi:hypothetical protein